MRIFLLALVACSATRYTAGVPNLAEVSPSVYRSGQVTTDEGWDTVAQLAAGRMIHVVKLDFDVEGSDAAVAVRGWDLRYLPIEPEGDQDAWDDAASSFKEPDEATVVAALTTLGYCRLHATTDFCLVHCTHGQDRTGYVVGRYRVQKQGWSTHAAYAEMIQRGFHWELVGLMIAWLRFAGR